MKKSKRIVSVILALSILTLTPSLTVQAFAGQMPGVLYSAYESDEAASVPEADTLDPEADDSSLENDDSFSETDESTTTETGADTDDSSFSPDEDHSEAADDEPFSAEIDPEQEALDAFDEESEDALAEPFGALDPMLDTITSSYTLYKNLNFDDSQNWGISYYKANQNKVGWSEDLEREDASLKLEKISSTDLYIDINELALSSNHIVFEQDIYLDENHLDAILFYLRDSVTVPGTNVVSTLVEISGDALKISDQTVPVTTQEWHRVSAAVDFSQSCYDLYLDGLRVFSKIAMNGNMKSPSLWRTYVGANAANGVMYIDKMRVYDGKKPRTIDGPKTIYANLTFENSQEWGLGYQRPNGNRLGWAKDEASGNGYLEIEKTNSNDMYMDINNLSIGSRHVVFEQDIYVGDSHPTGNIFYLRDSTTLGSQVNVGLAEINQGSVKIGERIHPLSANQWYKVSAVLDFINFSYVIYVDGTLVFDELTMNPNLQKPELWRFYLYSGDNHGLLRCDNFRVYDGTEPRDIDAEKPDEADIFSDADALAVLSGKTALQPYAGTMFFEEKKEDVKNSVMVVGDEALLKVDYFEKLFGTTIAVDGNVVQIGQAVTFRVGSNEMAVGGQQLAIDVAPRSENGIVWLPVRAYGENALADGCFYDDGHGMFLVGSQPISSADNRLKEANLYLFFQRKTPRELLALLLEQTEQDLGTHPRIFASEADFDALRIEIGTNPQKAAWFEEIKTRADNLLAQPPLEYKISNSRLLDVANSALQRAEALGMAWQITKDNKYASRLILELEQISSFADWHPNHTLDTGTMAMAAAIMYDWGYHAMTVEQCQSIGERLFGLGLETAHAAYYGTAAYPSWWTKTETNWGGVVNAGFMNLALSIAELDPEYAMDVVAKAKRSMEYTVYRVAPDGAWYEGPGYWSYLFQSLSYAMAGYESAFGEADEMISYMGMDGFAKYQLYFSDPNGDVNNFHDSDEGPIGCFGMFYLARQLDMPQLMEYRVNFMAQQNQAASVYDLLWYNVDAATTPSSENAPLDGYYRETEFFSMRQNWSDENALWVSAHGGSLNAAHDHIDAGAFVMNLGGVRWAIDLPKEPYSYVSDAENPSIQSGYNSYYFYRRKGEGHNTVVINPDQGLEMDQSQAAKVVALSSGTGRSFAAVDLSSVYRQDVNSYFRGYLLSEGRRAFTIRDEIDLKQDDSELYWFMHTKGQILVLDNETAIILQDGKQLKLQFVTDASESRLFVMNAEKLPQSPQFEETANPGVSKLALQLKADGLVTITVKMSLVGEASSLTGPEDTPIADWTVEGDDSISGEGETCESRLQGIKINGSMLPDFNPEVFYYLYGLGETESVSEITPIGSGSTEVLGYEMNNGNELKEIRVYDAQGKYTSYVVMIEPYSPHSLSQYIRHDVIAADASSEQTEENNLRGGSYDGNMDTRWSAEGDGEWLIHDLGEIKKIDAFGAALWKGSERKFYFDLEISEDGINFTPVVTGYTSSGTTEGIEIIPLEDSVYARYVKYIGYGNSVNKWNNVIELATYIKKASEQDKPVVTVVVSPLENIIYGQKLSNPSATASAGGEVFTYSYSGTIEGDIPFGPSETKPSKPGSYTVTATLDSATHQGSGVASFAIGKTNLTWGTGAVACKTYDGTTAAIVINAPVLYGVIGFDDVAVVKGDAAFTTANTGTNISIAGTGWGVGGKDAGFYNAPTAQPGFMAASISKKKVAVIADNKTITVGESLPGLTYTVSGLIPGETENSVFTGSPTLSCPSVSGSASGSYGIVVDLTGVQIIAGGNYAFASPASINGILTVLPPATSSEGGNPSGTVLLPPSSSSDTPAHQRPSGSNGANIPSSTSDGSASSASIGMQTDISAESTPATSNSIPDDVPEGKGHPEELGNVPVPLSDASNHGAFPWWIVLVVAAVIAGGGALWFLMLKRRNMRR